MNPVIVRSIFLETIRRKAADNASRKTAVEILRAQNTVNAANKSAISKQAGIESWRAKNESLSLLAIEVKRSEKESKAQNALNNAKDKENKVSSARTVLLNIA